MKAALAGRQDKRLVIAGPPCHGRSTASRTTPAHAYEERGVDMLSVRRKTRAQTRCRAARAAPFRHRRRRLYDLDYLSRPSRPGLPSGAFAIHGRVNATYETLKALRDGVPPANIKNGASPDLMKQGHAPSRLCEMVEGFSQRRPVADAARLPAHLIAA